MVSMTTGWRPQEPPMMTSPGIRERDDGSEDSADGLAEGVPCARRL